MARVLLNSIDSSACRATVYARPMETNTRPAFPDSLRRFGRKQRLTINFWAGRDKLGGSPALHRLAPGAPRQFTELIEADSRGTLPSIYGRVTFSLARNHDETLFLYRR